MATKTQMINRRNRLRIRIRRLDDTIADMERTGVKSASVSLGDGTKSSTMMYNELVAQRDAACVELGELNARLAGRGGFRLRHVMTVRS